MKNYPIVDILDKLAGIPLHFPFYIPFFDGFPFVVQFFSPGQADLNLDEVFFIEEDPQRN